jgi:hypothetical protein
MTTELHEGWLDESEVDALFADIEALATVVAIAVKSGPRERSDGRAEMHDARHALRAGAAVQIVYRYDGQAWCDTLIARGDRTRLVRSLHPDDERTSGPG